MAPRQWGQMAASILTLSRQCGHFSPGLLRATSIAASSGLRSNDRRKPAAPLPPLVPYQTPIRMLHSTHRNAYSIAHSLPASRTMLGLTGGPDHLLPVDSLRLTSYLVTNAIPPFAGSLIPYAQVDEAYQHLFSPGDSAILRLSY